MKLYEKIKKIREDFGLTIQEVYDRGVVVFGARKAISYRTLQRIEKGQISKFSSILKICYALGITLQELLKDTDLERQLLIRKKERIDEYTYNEKARASIISNPSSNLLALELALDPSGKTVMEQSPKDKIYEKWVYVVEGHLTCVIGEEKFILTSKDAISFDSSKPHHFENNGKKRCLAVVMQNPKHF